MKLLLLMAGMLVLAPNQTVTTFKVDPVHSSIGFKARHLGISSVNGRFEEYEATVTVDPDDLSTFKAEAVIQVSSVTTRMERRDAHLRSDAFFDADNFPTMVFKSREVRNIDGSDFEVVGDLTIRGTTREIVLDVEYGGVAPVRGSQTVAFEARGKLNRFDYGLEWGALTEIGGLVVGEEIRLILELEAKAQ
jgi:polyisoprenoid-binding protein YceI